MLEPAELEQFVTLVRARLPVWDDRRASDEAFHESLVRGLDALAEQGEGEINP